MSNRFEFTRVREMIDAMMEHYCDDKCLKSDDDPAMRRIEFRCRCEKVFSISLDSMRMRASQDERDTWSMPQDRIDFAATMNGGMLVVFESDEVWL